MDELPNRVDQLIDLLDRSYPAPDVRPGKSMEHLMYVAGQRSVIERLLRLREEKKHGRGE